MHLPVPNVINFPLVKAKERLKEYSLEIVEVNDSSFLDDVITNYKVVTEEEKVILYHNKRKTNSFSLSSIIDYINILGFVTGEHSQNKDLFKKRNIGSTDLGICVDNKDNILFLYGDSFSGTDCNIGMWNSNFIGISSQTDFSKNIIFDDIPHYNNDLVKPIIQGNHDKNLELNLDVKQNKEVTKIPTGGIRINDNVYVFYMSIRYWGKPGEWFVTYNQALKAKYNDLNNFVKVDTLKFDNTLNDQFGMIYPFYNEFDNKYVYLLANPGERFANTTLLRVKVDDFENLEKYEILTKEKEFKKLHKVKREDYFMILNNNNSSEHSISYNHYLKKWILVNLTSKGICLYLSMDLTSEFKEEHVVVTCEQLKGLYGGFIHPRLMDNGDRRMYMQVSQWSPIYNTSLLEIIFK